MLNDLERKESIDELAQVAQEIEDCGSDVLFFVVNDCEEGDDDAIMTAFYGTDPENRNCQYSLFSALHFMICNAGNDHLIDEFGEFIEQYIKQNQERLAAYTKFRDAKCLKTH